MSTAGYLEQLGDTDGGIDIPTTSTDTDAIEVSPSLIHSITKASEEAKQEAEGKNLNFNEYNWLVSF